MIDVEVGFEIVVLNFIVKVFFVVFFVFEFYESSWNYKRREDLEKKKGKFNFFFDSGFFRIWIIVKYFFIDMVVRVDMDVISEREGRKFKSL